MYYYESSKQYANDTKTDDLERRIFVYNVRKLCQPLVLEDFLPDADTTLASLYNCTTPAVFSELRHRLASLERHA